MQTTTDMDDKVSDCCGAQIVLTGVDEDGNREYQDHCSSCYNDPKWVDEQ